MTATLIIYHDPQGFKRQVEEIPSYQPLVKSLCELYPDGFKVETKVYKTCYREENEINLLDHKDDGYPVKKGDVFVVMHRPADPVSIGIAVGAFIISYAVASYLTPSIPDTPTAGSQSPNRQSINEVSNQQNSIRAMQRIPDVYGELVKVYPDLIAPQAYEYADSRTQRQVNILTPGFGEFDVDEVRVGNSPIVEASGAPSLTSSYFYIEENDTTIQSQVEFDESEEVNGQLIKGQSGANIPNPQPPFTTPFTDMDTGANPIGDGMFNQLFVFNTPNFQAEFQAFKEDDTFTISNCSDASFDGTWTFDFFDGVRVYCKEAFVSAQTGLSGDIGATNAANTDPVGPFILNDTAEQIWLDFVFSRGLKQVVDITITVTNTVTLNVFNFNRSYDRDTFDPVAITEKLDMLTADVGPTLDQRIYDVEVVRTDTASTDAQTPDEMKWARLSAVKNFVDSFPVPIIAVERFGDSQPTRASQNKINAIVNREIEIFDTGSGTFLGKSATENIFFIYMYHAVFRCQRTVNQINYQELQDSISDIEAINTDFTKFQFSFSNKNSEAKKELSLICNAGRVVMYEEGNLLRFYPVKRQTIPTAIFTRRHKAIDAETKNFRTKLPSEPDYISLEYYDVEDDAWRTINYSGTWGNVDDHGTKEQKITLSGATNWNQAYNRAALEYNLMSSQRISVTTQVTNDGLLLSLGDLILHVDGNDLSTIDGDIIGYSENAGDAILTLSETNLTERTSGGSYTVVLQDTLGNTPDLSLPFTIESENQIRVTGYTNANLTPVVTNQARSTFALIEDGQEEANKYIVVGKKPVNRTFVELELRNYDDTVFDIDSLVIPAKPPLRPA